MPLSEEELRLLEQMERALSEEDPKFASTLRGTSLRQAARRHAILGGISFALGVGVLMTGVVTKLWLIGVVGFIVMLASATISLNALRGQRVIAQPAEPRASRGFAVIDGGRSSRPSRRERRARPASRGSFMERLEERWRRRREENGGW